jgi:hypothetical protein
VRAPAHGRSFKTQQRDVSLEVDIVLGELSGLTAEAIEGLSAYRHGMPASLERR